MSWFYDLKICLSLISQGKAFLLLFRVTWLEVCLLIFGILFCLLLELVPLELLLKLVSSCIIHSSFRVFIRTLIIDSSMFDHNLSHLTFISQPVLLELFLNFFVPTSPHVEILVLAIRKTIFKVLLLAFLKGHMGWLEVKVRVF